MNVLVLGSGGREHAIAYKISKSSLVDNLYWTPGNGATEEIAENPGISLDDFDALANFAKENKIGLTVVGPEAPLVKGISNFFNEKGLKIFGPESNGAMIEGSKIFAKQIMKEAGIPTAEYRDFYDLESAKKYLKTAEPPFVIKADGLAAGKGVVISNSIEEANRVLEDMFVKKIFGDSGTKVVIESFLKGEEATVLALFDGESIVPLISSQDHKPVFDGDKGPNTGGMGAIAPAPVITEDIMNKVITRILEPLNNALKKRGIEYKGVVYAGLMIVQDDPYVVEFNCRFGDPETEAVLPLLKSDFLELLLNTVEGKLSEVKLEWNDGYCCDVVLCSGGYPGKYEKGKEIRGLESLKNIEDLFIFHAGTVKKDEKLFTNGGRVLNIAAVDKTLKSAVNKAYSYINSISFEGMHYRKDIGYRGLKHLE